MKYKPDRVIEVEAVILGSGVAGMTAALELAPMPVVLLTKTDALPGGSSNYAQGGVAAAVGQGDTPQAHARDTCLAGAGLNDVRMVDILTSEGPDRIYQLLEYGMPFDKDKTGKLSPTREAAHGCNRVLHAGGDATGHEMVKVLCHAVRQSRHVEVVTSAFSLDLDVDSGSICGVFVWHHREGLIYYRTPRVVLATGGIGQLYRLTTNPAESTGDGLAMALRAGATAADLEFVQFHPTALAVSPEGKANCGLLTEALRGEGAVLRDAQGHRFMVDLHPDAELAPRDVVARAVYEKACNGGAFLDATTAIGDRFPARFPTVWDLCCQVGFDPRIEPVPVAPAVHYHMGGVLTDKDGRTSIPGLWACGEVAATGVHGANRLASNSLLECLVFARRVARSIAATPLVRPGSSRRAIWVPQQVNPLDIGDQRKLLQDLMYRHGGLVRSGDELRSGLENLNLLACGGGTMREIGEFINMKTVGLAILEAALKREESRGAHYRLDFPESSAAWAFRSTTASPLLTTVAC